MRRIALCAVLLLTSGQGGAAALDVAWLDGGRLRAVQLHQEPSRGGHAPTANTLVPLGSLWKLFVHVYATDTGVDMPDYHCGGRIPDEVYCCDPGRSIDADAALAQSCGLLFAPARLMLARGAWQAYWGRLLGTSLRGELAWLADPARLGPGRQVRLGALLRVLGAIPPASRERAEAALLRVVLDGRGAGSVRWFGNRLRVKTFTWHRPNQPDTRLGGAAGWLADGTPIWFSGDDSSSGIFKRWAPQLAASPALQQRAGGDSGCVLVDFFARYPVARLDGPAGPARSGALNGRHVVRFANGQRLAFTGTGDMTMTRGADGKIRIQGRFGVNDYVARVLDREADATQTEAAKALAIAARTYLQQNARPVAACQHIADSSATQRVSPNPPSASALVVARWTDALVLEDAQVRYHRDLPGTDVLAWTEAREQARNGEAFDAILAHAYPRASLTIAGVGGQRCRRLHPNEAWLAHMLPRWERVLLREPGYERPAQLPTVCALDVGAPYSEQSRGRVFMRPLATREDRITLAHEYIHIALRHHPRGQDEHYVEGLARRLADQGVGSD